jgi:isohexenylglutaconyl-CoA hydratase
MAKARLTAAAELLQPAAIVFSRAAQGAEGIEGTTAFIQKRKPNWAVVT